MVAVVRLPPRVRIRRGSPGPRRHGDRRDLRDGPPARVEDYTDRPGTWQPRPAREASTAVRVLRSSSTAGSGERRTSSRREAPLPEGLEERLAEFTELVATAIANSEAHEELTRLAEEQAALRRVATLVAAGAPPTEVFEAVSAEVAALLPADGSALTRYEEDGTVTALSGWTTEGGYRYVGRRYEVEDTVSGLIFETGAPGRVAYHAEARGEAAEAAREMGWRSSVGAPITVEWPQLWGVLAVISKSETPCPRHRAAPRRVHRARRDGDREQRGPRAARTARRRTGGISTRGYPRRRGGGPAACVRSRPR